jgi:HSP20 family protein
MALPRSAVSAGEHGKGTIMNIVRRERQNVWPTGLAWPEERIDKAFRDMFRDFFTGGVMLDRYAEGLTNAMRLEEFVEDGICVIRAELPGIDPDTDIEINVTDGMVHLRAHREERKEEDRPSGYHSEFRYGMFERTVRLPDGATEADVKATYKDGVLDVRFPVTTTEKTPTRIPVEHS